MLTAQATEYRAARLRYGALQIRAGGIFTGTVAGGIDGVDWAAVAGISALVSPFVMFGLEQKAASDREKRLMKFQMDMREQDRAHDLEMLNLRGEQALALQNAANEGSGGGSTVSSAAASLGGAFSG